MFREVLQEVVDGTDGAIAALLMGLNGIAVDQYIREDAAALDLETIGMEYSVILRDIRKAAESLRSGAASEVSVRSETMTTVLRLLNDEYFVALALGPKANVGKGRFLLRTRAERLLAELE